MLQAGAGYGPWDLARDALLLVGGAVGAYFVALRQMHAEAAERKKAIGAALAAETDRIRGLLKVPNDGILEEAAMVAQPPVVHPWLEQVIIDSAAISGKIVSNFMGLQQSLRQMELARDPLAKGLEMLKPRPPGSQVTIDPQLVTPQVGVAKAVYLGARTAALHALDQIDGELRRELDKRTLKRIFRRPWKG